MNKIEIEIPEGKKAEWVNGVLTLVDEKPQDITERIKTFEDAVVILGGDNQAVIDYYAIADETSSEDILAFAKLRVITEALNEGWKRAVNEEQCYYYPCFYIYTEKEYEGFDEDKKAYYVPLQSNNNVPAYYALVYSSVYFDGMHTSSHYGERLALKNRELAEYCGKQFLSIWTDYLFR